MGSQPWWCKAPYKESLEQTFIELRHREFLEKFATDNKQHTSYIAIERGIEKYIEKCDADGTCSILDIERLSTNSEDSDFGLACPLSKETLIEIFGTDKPTKEMLNDENEAIDELYEMIERGQAIYVIAYAQEKPVEIYFWGMSYD